MENPLQFLESIELSTTNLPFLLWGIFGVLTFFAAVNSVIFFYHWRRYHVGSILLTGQTLLMYVASVGVLLFIIFTALLTYTL